MRTLGLVGLCLTLGACDVPPPGIWNGDANLCPHSAPALDSCNRGTGAVALAVCGALQADNTLTIDSRASGLADLLVDGLSTTSAPLQVSGNFYSAGGIDARNTEEVSGDVHSGGDWHTSAPIRVSGDAMVSGTLDAENTVAIDGTLSVAAQSGTGAVTAGRVVTGAVAFSSPLDCAQAVRASALVTAAADPAAAAAAPHGALVHVSQPTQVTLGCGRYHFDTIESDNTLDLHINGATVLIVDGDVHIAAPTTIDLADGASLEMVIGGSLEVDNELTIGDPTHAVQLTLGGTLHVAAPMQIYGTLIAPDSSVGADNTLEVWGAAMVGPLRIAAPLVVHDGPTLTGAGCAPSL